MRVTLLFLTLFSLAFANIGEIVMLKGKVNIIRDNKIFSAQKGMQLQREDVVNSFEKSRIQIRFTDNTIVTLGRKSRFVLNDYLYDAKEQKTDFSFTKGLFKVVTGEIGKVARDQFKLKTRTATIGIRGTEIDGFVSPEKEIITCTKGAIWVEANGRRVDVDAGQTTIIRPGTSPSKPKNYTMEKLIREGIAAFEAKEFQKASDIFSRLIKIDDQNPIFFYYRGKSEGSLKEYDRAINDFSQVLRLDEAHMKSRYELGVVYYRIGALEEAIKEFDIVVSSGNEADLEQPHTYIMSLYWLGVIYREKGDVDEAVEYWQKLLGYKLKEGFRTKVKALIAKTK